MQDRTPADTDRIARAICAERCAFMGEPPCWEMTDTEGPLPWPNPDCDEPGCQALGAAALAAVQEAGNGKQCPSSAKRNEAMTERQTTDEPMQSREQMLAGLDRETTGYWLRIDCPGQFTAGVRIRDGYVVGTSPRFDGMFPGWTEAELRQFAASAGWTVEVANA